MDAAGHLMHATVWQGIYYLKTMYLHMEESAKQIFRIKYITVVILLNIFLFATAAAVAIFFIVPAESGFKTPVVAILIIIALVSGFVTRKQYIATKEWLEIHAKPEESSEEPSDQEGSTR